MQPLGDMQAGARAETEPQQPQQLEQYQNDGSSGAAEHITCAMMFGLSCNATGTSRSKMWGKLWGKMWDSPVVDI